MSGKQEALHKEHQKPACTSSPLIEGRACAVSKPLFSVQQVAVAHLARCLPVHRDCKRNCKSLPSPCPLTLTADCVSLLLVFCLSQFEILNEP